jgi:signal transduction histidine kinase
MKSIRLSLLVYFLGLLAVALFAASLLVYRTAKRTLEDKREAMEQLIQTQYNERCRDAREKLDDGLREQAQSLARLVQVQLRFRPDIQPVFMLGLWSSSLSPNGYVLAPTWIAEAARGPRPEPLKPPEPPSPVYLAFRQKLPYHLLPGYKEIKLDELKLPSDAQAADYFQIDSPQSESYHSRSMGDRSFPLDTSVIDPDEIFHWVFDNTVLEPNTPVRRVVLQASGVDTVWPPRRGRSTPPQSRRDNVPSQPRPNRGSIIYVHCAADMSKLDATLAGFSERRDEELADVASKTKESLCDLGTYLSAISLAVFAATGIGSFWLVRLGLSPLRRLSDAVSRVSAKDFRLPLGERPLPRELQPIAGRLSTTLDLLKRAFAREKQAAADISHELRTPLAALLTTTELALRKSRSPEQYREFILDCHASAQQMNQIVERLLTLARLDAGVDRLRPQAVDASALAQQCATVIRPLAEARGLRLTVKDPYPPPQPGTDTDCVVRIDPDKLREILTNLLHNAIQYNRPGGSVDLRVARQNGSLEVEVSDTGIGIAPEAREHIFERFYRVDPSRGCDDLHAGLGLAIVKEYIDLMGGSIGVESTEGQGSTFRVLFPVHSAGD